MEEDDAVLIQSFGDWRPILRKNHRSQATT